MYNSCLRYTLCVYKHDTMSLDKTQCLSTRQVVHATRGVGTCNPLYNPRNGIAAMQTWATLDTRIHATQPNSFKLKKHTTSRNQATRHLARGMPAAIINKLGSSIRIFLDTICHAK
jgi:hypothetical protein